MRRLSYTIAAVLALCACTVRQDPILAELDTFKAEFSEWPGNTPTDKTADAPLAGNGDIGLTMASSAEGITFYIGKNDFWRALQSYPEGGIALPGALRLTADLFSQASYHAEQLPGSAEIRAAYQTGTECLHVTSWVSATENNVVIELESDKSISLDVSFLPTEDGPLTSVIAQGTDGGCSWMTRSFCDEPRLQWDSHVALALNRQVGTLNLKPGKKQTLVLAVYTNMDTPDWKRQAISEAQSCRNGDVKSLKDAHRSWWAAFWNLSHVDIGDKWLERYYYQSQYLLACSSRPGKFAPGLWGPFITRESTAWAGDYHLNYNYESPLWGCYSSNHICLAENYDQPLLDYMDKGMDYARELLGCRGLYYPVGIGPHALSSASWPDTDEKMKTQYGYDDHMLDGGNMFWGQKSNASFGAINMMMRFYATWDESYARRVYPYIVGCADFWESYLVKRNGKYESVNDSFYESAPGPVEKSDVNSACSLGLIRMVMRGALDISEFLGADEDKRDVWDDILTNISDFPVGYREDGRLSLKICDRIGVDGRSGDVSPWGLNRIHMHGMLIPPMVCGPILDPEMGRIMLDDMNHWAGPVEGRDWGNSMSNGVETVYPGAARLGYDPEKLLKYLKQRIRMGSAPNCYILAMGGGVETLAAVPFTVNEMLMQSFEGVLRLFPCWIRSQDASFRCLRANGAFLVSSSIKDGVIQDVELLSEKGRPCIMENPWPDQVMLVRHADGSIESLHGQTVGFQTREGETLRISCGASD